MSQDEVELRDMITDKLTNSGFLLDIKAQIRAAVLLTLSNDGDSKIPIVEQKNKLIEVSNQVEGNLAISLVKDFLQQMKLKQTLSVFELEAGIESMKLNDRKSIIDQFTKDNKFNQTDEPLIYGFIRQKNEPQSNHQIGQEQDTHISSKDLSSPKSKRKLPQLQDSKDSKYDDKSEDTLTEFSDVIGLPDSSNRGEQPDKVISPYQAPQKNRIGSASNEYSYDESFSSDKSSNINKNDKSDQDDSIKEIEEEIDEKTESKTCDITLDSDRSVSFDYVENVKRKV